MMKLQFAYSRQDEDIAKKIISSLTALGYQIIPVKENLPDEDMLTLALFTSSTKEEDFLNDLPWLKKQEEYSSIHHLKVMPFFVYSSKKEDPEVAFEGNAGTLYEDVFSGEFKPYGWDTSSSHPEVELERVIEDYNE